MAASDAAMYDFEIWNMLSKRLRNCWYFRSSVYVIMQSSTCTLTVINSPSSSFRNRQGSAVDGLMPNSSIFSFSSCDQQRPACLRPYSDRFNFRTHPFLLSGTFRPSGGDK